MKLEWNVYINNFNRKEIEVYNIFQHTSFLQDCAKVAKKTEDREEFARLIHRELYYYYWSKCEWEILLYDWPPRDTFNALKVDVAKQVELNWDRFIDYLWDNKAELVKEAKKKK